MKTFKSKRRSMFLTKALACIFAASLFTASAQIDTVNCIPSPYMVNEYMKDAKILALRHLYTVNNPLKDSITIPATLFNSILRDLTAINKTSNNTVSVSIFNYCGIYCGIHCKEYPNISSLGIFPDTSYQWVKNIFAGNLISGDDTIDALVNQYGLIYGNIYINPVFIAFDLLTSYPLNVMALGKRFELISGVNSTNTSASSLDGDNITMVDSGAFREYIFDRGFDDCWNGCLGHHFWKFRVYDGCIVEYLGEYGDQIPTSVNEISDQETLWSLSPNPATTHLTVTLPQLIQPALLTITNISGSILQTEQLITANTTIPLNLLPAGLYFVTVQNRQHRISKKFIKLTGY